jgi:hypothetical protein
LLRKNGFWGKIVKYEVIRIKAKIPGIFQEAGARYHTLGFFGAGE